MSVVSTCFWYSFIFLNLDSSRKHVCVCVCVCVLHISRAVVLFLLVSLFWLPTLSVMYICALSIADFFEGQPALLSLPLEVYPAIYFSRLKPACLKYLITEIITFNLPIVYSLYLFRSIMNNIIYCMPIKFVSHVPKI